MAMWIDYGYNHWDCDYLFPLYCPLQNSCISLQSVNTIMRPANQYFSSLVFGRTWIYRNIKSNLDFELDFDLNALINNYYVQLFVAYT
jgi:hypothetical protein